MVLYNYDSNIILVNGCNSRTGKELTATYNKLYKYFTKTEIVPIIQRIDYELSKILI